MSQTIKALITLRELILNGELPASERLLEVALVERLGVSRTPIRAALAKLANEGLLEKVAGGGYTVREFTERDIEDAIETRGTLEGMAARLAAERGASPLAIGRIRDCLAQIDKLLEKKSLDTLDIEHYLDLNDTFHRQLVLLAESFVIERTLDHVMTLPFASPNAFVIAQTEIELTWKVFFIAQEHHRGLVEAIENREGSRAELLAREHARLSLSTLRTVARSKTAFEKVPGFRLVQGTSQ